MAGSTGLEPAASGVTALISRGQCEPLKSLTEGATPRCHAANLKQKVYKSDVGLAGLTSPRPLTTNLVQAATPGNPARKVVSRPRKTPPAPRDYSDRRVDVYVMNSPPTTTLGSRCALAISVATLTPRTRVLFVMTKSVVAGSLVPFGRTVVPNVVPVPSGSTM